MTRLVTQERQILDFLQIEYVATATSLLLQLLEILLLMLITLNALIVPVNRSLARAHCIAT